MKKLSLMLVFVALLATVFALSTFAAFTRGPENDAVVPADVAKIELIAGSTHGAGYITGTGILDGNFSTWWGGPTGSKIKITLTNEWEIKDAKAVLAANWCGCKISFYAADDTLLGSQGVGGYSANTGLCWGGDGSNADRTDFNGAVNKISYGDNDKAVKYIVYENTGDKWGYLPMISELILTGTERIPSTGCEAHQMVPVYSPEPTCLEDGVVIYTCSICGAADTPKVAPALGHAMGEYTIKTLATCISAPVIEFACERCEEVISREVQVDNVIDYADKFSVKTEYSGGGTYADAMFDGNMDSYTLSGGPWAVVGSIELDMAYYISSVTVWLGNTYDADNSNSAWLIFYYQVPGEDEWVFGGTMATPAASSSEKYEHTLELATPVYADAIKIYVGDPDGTPQGNGPGLQSYCGRVYEAKVSGSIVKDVAAGHTWVAGDVTAPTCFEAGYTTYTCSVCSATKKSDFVRETDKHSFTVVDNTEEKNDKGEVTWSAKEPTCTEAGEYKYRCETCRYTQKRKVDPLGHTEATPTCTEDAVCARCDTVTATAIGHNYVAGEQAEDGSVTYTCANCNDVYVINNSAVNGEYFLGTNALTFADGVLTAMGNTYSYENNLTTGMITTDDETMYFQVIEGKIYHKGAEVLHQHNEETLIVETTDATCTENGSVVTICPFCGPLREETIVAEGHTASWSETREYVSATCMTEGYEKDICAVCNEEYTVVFPVDTVFGHREIWGTGVGEDPTCISDGYYSYQCELCEETITTVYPANEDAHVWDQDLHVFVPATCVAGGYEYNKCSLCETEVTEEFGPSEWAHKYDNVFASNGVIVYTCTLCGDSYEEELDPALPYGDITAEIVANDPEYPMMVEPAYYSVSVPGNYVLTIKNEADVYIIYSDKDVLIEESTFEFTLAEGESITFSVMTSDRAAGTVELNLASADNAMLNGTYVTPDGSALFVFADGALTVTDTNEMMPTGFAGAYTYNYNSVTGEVAVNPSTLMLSVGLDMGGNTQIYLFGRMPLNAYVPPMDVVLGDNSFTFVNDNYYFNDQKVVFTATEAGTYVITASETGVVIVESMYGEVELPLEVELAEGESFEFIVATSADVMSETEDTVVVNIAKKVTHVHVEEIIPAILPTPSVQGYTAGVKCSACGETLEAPKAIEVTELEFADTTLRYNGISLSAKENISLIYRAIGAKNFKSAYAVFVIEGKEYLVDEYVVESDGRYKFNFKETRPQLMNSNVEAYIYGENADGSYTMNKNTDYSVKKYIVGQLKKNDPALTTAMSDILYMGAMTQLYMGVNTNALITDIVEAEGYTLTPSAFTSISKDLDIQAVTGDRTTGTDWKGISLAFGATTEVVFKFETDNVEGLKVKVNIAGADKYYDVKELTKDDNGRYVVYFDGAKSFEYNEVITATFERDGVQVGSTFTYSINTFLARNYQNTSSYSESARNLMKAIYTYGESLAAYFN